MKKNTFFLSMLMLLTISTNSVWGATVSDAINRDLTGITGTSYTAWSGKTATSDAVYAGNSAGGNSSIQLRSSNSNSGIVTTTSGGKVRRITVVWNSNTTSGRTLNVYGKNTAYSAATDLYDNSKQGTLIGTLVYNTSTQLNINQDFEYIGFRSASGAMYLTGISVEWETDGTGGGDNPVLESIVVSGTPTKTAYYAGDEFDPAGLVVTGTYSDDSQASIASGITWAYDPSQELTLNQTSIGVTATVDEISSPKYNVTGLTVTEAPAADNYELVTNVADLAEGDKIIIVNTDATKAISTTQNNNNRGAADVTATNGVITPGDAVQILTLGFANQHWTLYTGAGYLYASSGSSNQMKTQATNNANGEWTISISNEVATLTAQGTNSRNVMQYNAQSAIFACYASASQMNLKIFKKVDGSVRPEAGLAYAEADQKKLTILSETFTAPTLVNPNSLAVSYASNNTDVAEVNASTGAVTIKAAGVAVITASFDGNDDYKAGSASYTIYVTAHAGTEADPYTVADARLAIDCGAGVTGVYATGIVSQIVTAYNAQYGNITYNFSTDGQTTSDQLQAFRGKAKDGENFTSVDDVKVGDEVVVKGNLTKYNSTYEFAADNQLYSLTRNKEDAGLAYAVTDIEKNVDDAAFTNALTNPHSLAVTYSSSAEAVATIDENGEVTIVGMGTTTIKATFAGDAVYLAGEASYTLKVNDPSLTKVTFDATVDKGESPLSKSNITLSCSNGVLNNESEYRLYKSSTTTFACSAGNIAMIEFIGVSGNPASGFAAPAEGNFVTDGNNATWTGNATSVSFEASGAQVRATKIFVSYREDTRTEAGLAYEVEEVEKVVGDEPFTNALTNPNSVYVSFTSSDETVAEVAANGQATIKAVGTTTISAVFEGNETYKPATVSYTLTVAAPVAPFDGDYFVKVTSANDLTSGEYLIVYGEGSLAFNGALETLDAVSNTIPVVFDHDKIQGTNEALTAVFTIDATAGTIQSASGMYIGQTSDANGLTASAETAYTNTITFDEEGNANIVSGGAYLRYNSASNQTRFRYYKSSSYTNQQTIQLYKKESAEPVEPEHNYEVVRSGLEIGRHYTICMPKKIVAVDGATFWGINNCDEGKTSVYLEMQQPPFEAGTPFIFYATETTLKVAYEGEETDTPIENGALRGTFVDMNHAALEAAGNQVYLMYQNALHPLGTDNHLDAKRAYLLFEELVPGTPAPGRQVKRMPLQTDVTTGVEDAETSTQPKKMLIDGQLFIRCGEKLYNATGSMVK